MCNWALSQSPIIEMLFWIPVVKLLASAASAFFGRMLVPLVWINILQAYATKARDFYKHMIGHHNIQHLQVRSLKSSKTILRQNLKQISRNLGPFWQLGVYNDTNTTIKLVQGDTLVDETLASHCLRPPYQPASPGSLTSESNAGFQRGMLSGNMGTVWRQLCSHGLAERGDTTTTQVMDKACHRGKEHSDLPQRSEMLSDNTSTDVLSAANLQRCATRLRRGKAVDALGWN